MSTAPTSMKRNPNAGRAIWQFAAITTPATIKPPSIFSTLNRDMGVGHFNFAPRLPPSVPSSAAIAQGRAGLSLGKCDLSVWNGVPNVITEQVDNRCGVILSFSLPADCPRPPSSSASQLIARCFIASLTFRMIGEIFPRENLLARVDLARDYTNVFGPV